MELWDLFDGLRGTTQITDWLLPKETRSHHRSGLQPKASVARPSSESVVGGDSTLTPYRRAPPRGVTDLRGLRNAQAPHNLVSDILRQAELFPPRSRIWVALASGIRRLPEPPKTGSGWRGSLGK